MEIHSLPLLENKIQISFTEMDASLSWNVPEEEMILPEPNAASPNPTSWSIEEAPQPVKIPSVDPIHAAEDFNLSSRRESAPKMKTEEPVNISSSNKMSQIESSQNTMQTSSPTVVSSGQSAPVVEEKRMPTPVSFPKAHIASIPQQTFAWENAPVTSSASSALGWGDVSDAVPIETKPEIPSFPTKQPSSIEAVAATTAAPLVKSEVQKEIKSDIRENISPVTVTSTQETVKTANVTSKSPTFPINTLPRSPSVVRKSNSGEDYRGNNYDIRSFNKSNNFGRSEQQPKPLPTAAKTTPLPRFINKSSLNTKLNDLKEELSGSKILIISDLMGRINEINELAKKYSARAIIHVGNFGLYDEQSYKKVNIDVLRCIAERQLNNELSKSSDEEVRRLFEDKKVNISDFSKYCKGKSSLSVPVYVAAGEDEDISVLEKLLKNVYHVPNLYILNHQHSFAVSSPSLVVRLFGLGGSLTMENLFDIGTRGSPLVCGNERQIWSNMTQIGELMELASNFDENSNEIRLFVSSSYGKQSEDTLSHLVAYQINASNLITPSNSTSTVLLPQNIASTLYSSKIKADRNNLKMLWEQVYFAANESFTERQRQLCKLFMEKVAAQNEEDENMDKLLIGNFATGNALVTLSNVGIVVQTQSLNSRQVTKKTESSPVSAPVPVTESIPIPQSVQSTSETIVESPVVVDTKLNKTSEKSNDTDQQAIEKAKSPSVEESKVKPSPGWKIDDDISAMLPSSTSKVPDSIPSTRSPAFFIDKLSSDKQLELSLFISNLPYDTTGEELDKAFFQSYDIEFIDLMGNRHSMAQVIFKKVEDVEKAFGELQNALFNGREIRVRRDRRFDRRI